MFILVEIPQNHIDALEAQRRWVYEVTADTAILFPPIFDPAFLRGYEAEDGTIRGVYSYDVVWDIMGDCCRGDYVDLDNEIDLLVKSFGEKAPLFD